MKAKVFVLTLMLAFGIIFIANAQNLKQGSVASIISAFRFYKAIDNISISTPTVVAVPFSDDFMERFDFAVWDQNTSSFEPYYLKQETLVNEIPVSVSSIPTVSSLSRIIDKDTRTFTDFLLPENVQGQAQITLSSESPITSSVLTVLLDNNVALPTSVEIRAVVDGQKRIIVAKRIMDQQTVRFPQTTSDSWEINFTYGQPLRISELRLNQDNATRSNIRAVRFLAQPGHSYRTYFDPDRFVLPSVGEAGNLATALDILEIPAIATQSNADYIIADVDRDGVPDIRDNCISISNADQRDENNNGRGDICDDFDQDGLINSQDNCPDNPNINQKDKDSDGLGDVCDSQESRTTERYPWIPWVGIGFAAVVIIVLLVMTARANPTKPGDGI